jgi:hypothetical protein
MKNTLRILAIQVVFLIIPLVAYLTTPRFVPTIQSSSVYATDGNCAFCQQGSVDAWFEAYDLARANGLPWQACVAEGDRAKACFIRAHWNDSCVYRGGMIPEQEECGQ